MNNLYNKTKETYHKIDIIEKYDDQEVVFTMDSKCFPIEDVIVLDSDRFCELLDKVDKKTITDSEKLELGIHMGRVKLVSFNRSTPIPTTKEEREKEFEEFKSRYKEKKSIKEYLLSPLSNLFPTFFHPSTSKG